MNKLFVICGPTATGKTSLGIRLAKKFHGEIISADSRQVYKGMDIGTGKDLPLNAKLKINPPVGGEKLQCKIKNEQILKPYRLEEIPVWLYDIVDPDYQFNVADYVECAKVVIEDIWKRKKLPILAGGTGFYIKALINGIETLGVSPDWKLRKKLSNYPINKLSNYLKKLDLKRWEGMNESDRKNPRRLIRAIEIAKKYQISNIKNQKYKSKIKNLLSIGLTAPYEILYQRIDQRVEERVKMGVEEEIRKLQAMGYAFENSVLGITIGYKEWHKYIKNQKSKIKNEGLRKEMIQRWKYDEHGLARRQMTWFKRDKKINWFDITRREWQDKVERLVNKWYNA